MERKLKRIRSSEGACADVGKRAKQANDKNCRGVRASVISAALDVSRLISGFFNFLSFSSIHCYGCGNIPSAPLLDGPSLDDFDVLIEASQEQKKSSKTVHV